MSEKGIEIINRVRVRGNTPLTLLNWTFSDFLPIVCRIFSDVKGLSRAHRAETEQKSSSQSGTEQKLSRNQGSQSATEQKPSRKPGDQSGTEQNFLSQSYFKRHENKHRQKMETSNCHQKKTKNKKKETKRNKKKKKKQKREKNK